MSKAFIHIFWLKRYRYIDEHPCPERDYFVHTSFSLFRSMLFIHYIPLYPQSSCRLHIYNTNIHAPSGIFIFALSVLYPYFYVLIVLAFLRRADHSSRGVLPTLVCHSVWSRNLENDEAKTRKWAVKAGKRRRRTLSWVLPFVLIVQHTQHKRLCPRRISFFFVFTVLCTSSVFSSLSWLSCIFPFWLYWQHTTLTSTPPAAFEAAIPTTKQQQKYASDRSPPDVQSLYLYRFNHSYEAHVHNVSYTRIP
jgi:hypothetical protein